MSYREKLGLVLVIFGVGFMIMAEPGTWFVAVTGATQILGMTLFLWTPATGHD